MEDFSTNSHLQFDFLLSLKGVEFWQGEQVTWRANNYDDYVLLRTGTDIAQFERKLTRTILDKYVLPSMIEAGDKDVEKVSKSAKLILQPVGDIHLRSFDIYDSFSHGDIRFVWLFGGIACFILIIACINFINLSTAKSANRAKEVGLRKVVGSARSGLINQFLTESILLSIFSFALGMILAWVLLPYFNTLSAKSLTIPWNEWWLAPVLLAGSICIGILAGLYPSFYLSSFKPINVLKGQVSKGSKNSILRNGLVVFQFTTSIVLIIGTIVIYNQMQFILNKKLGYDKEQVVMIEGTNTMGDKIGNFKKELLKLSSVRSVSVSDFLPVSDTKRNGNTFYNEGKSKVESGVDGQIWQVDNDYLQTMGIKLVAGRNFSPSIASDSQAVIINQALASKLNLKDAIGKRITNGWQTFQVIGVVQDFNFESLREHVGGLCMILGNSSSITSIKVGGVNMRDAISSITTVWKNFAPAQPIRYNFLDKKFASMYADVQRSGRIFSSFAILAIIIACLGLFALSAFMAEQRNKEIGIRKVLGASAANITTLLSLNFAKLVMIAILLASPIAWWAMNKWLQDFAYRVDISWWIFLLAAVVVTTIAMFTVCFQAIKAALVNPVQTLRSE
jgi:putative ABC transport system permease protein